jgi:hypothetical protein
MIAYRCTRTCKSPGPDCVFCEPLWPENRTRGDAWLGIGLVLLSSAATVLVFWGIVVAVSKILR